MLKIQITQHLTAVKSGQTLHLATLHKVESFRLCHISKSFVTFCNNMHKFGQFAICCLYYNKLSLKNQDIFFIFCIDSTKLFLYYNNGIRKIGSVFGAHLRESFRFFPTGGLLMATIKDVARLAGVSISTVSKYINGGNVRRENIEPIRQAIDELDYRVNPFARSLKAQRSRSIGILLPSMIAPFFGNVVTALDKALRFHGYHTIISCYGSNHGLERDNLKFLISNGVDGLVYIPEDLSADEFQELTENYSIPTVQIDRMIRGVDTDAVLGSLL